MTSVIDGWRPSGYLIGQTRCNDQVLYLNLRYLWRSGQINSSWIRALYYLNYLSLRPGRSIRG